MNVIIVMDVSAQMWRESLHRSFNTCALGIYSHH